MLGWYCGFSLMFNHLFDNYREAIGHICHSIRIFPTARIAAITDGEDIVN